MNGAFYSRIYGRCAKMRASGYSLRELFNALRYVVRTGCTWRYLPHDLPPWATCYQQ